MKFLNPAELREWYDASLRESGFVDLSDPVFRVWKDAVIRGNNALPPGFLGALLERLLDQPVGVKSGVQAGMAEKNLLTAIFADPGFYSLRGRFLLSGARWSSPLLLPALDRICSLLGGFSHTQVHFSAKDLEETFSPPPDPDLPESGPAGAGARKKAAKAAKVPEGPKAPTISPSAGGSGSFDPSLVLREVFQTALETVSEQRFRLSEADLFEIQNPDLFPAPPAQTLYRRMAEAIRVIGGYINTQVTLREETGEVIARFGEPQVLPLGGYEALSNRGDVASLVPSELAYIEDGNDIDLFDHKYLENQLLFFKREEGSVYRIRRRIALVMDLTPFVENERHLALLFGFLYVFADKLLSVLMKDIVHIGLFFTGYKPSALEWAYRFLEHFLARKGMNESLNLFPSMDKLPEFLGEEAFQHWVIGNVERGEGTYVPLQFPQTDEFAARSALEQFHILGDEGNRAIEDLVWNRF